MWSNAMRVATAVGRSGRTVSISPIVCIVLAVAPLLSGGMGGGGYHNTQRILEAACLSVAWCFAMQRCLGSARLAIQLNPQVVLCLSVFFLIGVFSGLDSYAPRFAFFEWASFLLLLTLAGVIALEVKEREGRFLDWVLLGCGWGCVLYLLNVVLVYVATVTSGGQLRPDEFIPGFDNYRFFNHAQTISLPMLALLILRSERFSRQYWCWFVATSLWWALLFFSGGRGTFAGVLVGVGTTFLLRRGSAMAWCREMVLTAVVGLGAYALFFTLIPGVLGLTGVGFSPVIQRTLMDPASNRGPLWQLAWALIAEHPWLGVGPAHFAHYGRELDIAAHPHDWILQIGSEWGGPALLCLSVAVSQACRSLLNCQKFIDPVDTSNQATLCAWLTIAVAVLVDGLVSGLIVMPVSQLWIALYIGCAWGWAMRLALSEASTPSFKTAKMIPVILVIALALLWSGLYPEISDLKTHQANALKSPQYSHKSLRPRIWAAGYF